MLNMITGMNEYIKNINKAHITCKLKVNLMGKNVIQISGEIMTNVDVSLKSFMYAKMVIYGILLHAVMKMENI